MTSLAEKVAALAQKVEKLTGTDGEHATAIPALRLYRSSRRTTPAACMFEPSICLVLQGRKRAVVGQDVYRYDPANCLVVTADAPMLGEITQASARAPYLCVRLWLDFAIASDVIASLPPRREQAPTRAITVRPIDAALLDAMARLVALLDEPEHAPTLAPLVLREITYRLLVGEDGARLRQIVVNDGGAGRIGAALAWMKARFAEPISVESLAQRVGMSPSAFHQQWKRVTGMSPLQYQKHLRLNEARRLLLTERLDAGQASFRVGYESPSQFSREYSRLFGAPPRRDVIALLASDQPIDV